MALPPFPEHDQLVIEVSGYWFQTRPGLQANFSKRVILGTFRKPNLVAHVLLRSFAEGTAT